MNRNLTICHEYDVLYRDGEKNFDNGVALPKKSFDNLWQYILENSNDDVEQVMSVHTRNGRKYIKTSKYVGTIQTKDGHTIEILPKIFKSSSQTITDAKVSRRVFLLMLKHFTDSKAKTFQNAALEAKEGFPLLEAYISNYIKELERVFTNGIKKNYSLVEGTQNVLKGRLLVNKQVAVNACQKTKFYVAYNKYVFDIPQNRIIYSTLLKLRNIARSSSNRMRINEYIVLLSEVGPSYNVSLDLQRSVHSNRLFDSYKLLLQWSDVFLRGYGITTFSGKCLNQSFLFSAERLFEDFIAFLFRKYCNNYKVSAQHKKYYLVDKHKGTGIFQLRPDIFVESKEDLTDYECVIIDTKWKSLDSSRIDKQYFIDMKDIYQLYAYGQKYKKGQSVEYDLDITPQLVLLYPNTEKFSEKLDDFIYDEILNEVGLSLMVVPFDLSDATSYESQIVSIINSLNVQHNQRPIYLFNDNTFVCQVAEDSIVYKTSPLMLVGCYKSKEHLEWIINNSLYNIRFGNRKGAVNNVISAKRLLLYNMKDYSEYEIYNIDSLESRIADYNTMKQLDYPNPKPNKQYVLYKIVNKLKRHPLYDVKLICSKSGYEPLFIEY